MANLSKANLVTVEGIASLTRTTPALTRDAPPLPSPPLSKSNKETPNEPTPPDRQWLISSPYTNPRHQLNLSTLDPQSQILALALQLLAPTSKDYATTPYASAFHWDPILSAMRSLVALSNTPWPSRTFYVVEFRSLLKPNIDHPLLYQLDEESHAEAVASGGLLKYWYGVPDEGRRNLATCFWRSREDAIKGGRGEWHKQARGVVPRMYERILVVGLTMVVEEGCRGVRFEGGSSPCHGG